MARSLRIEFEGAWYQGTASGTLLHTMQNYWRARK